MAISSLGLGSGIDIRSIVDGLVAAERDPQDFQLTRKETDIQAKISSVGSFKSALSDFRASFAGLRVGSQFNTLDAESSNSEVVTASAESNAEQGSFTVEAKQKAQAHSLASAGFASAKEIVGTGTLTFKFGTTDYNAETDTYNGFTQNSDKAALSITLDETNNTLTGLRDAINDADAGVTASIIFDGSNHRLVFTSKDTGAENSLQISTDDASLSAFEFNETTRNVTQTQTAQDAIMSMNGLDVSNATNTFSETIKGVTLDLLKVSLDEPVSITVSQSQTGVSETLQSFVDSYNALITNVKELTGYDPTTQTAGLLIGDAAVRSSMSQIRSVLGDMVSGLEGSSIRTLYDLGVATQSDGSLELDTSKLTRALNDDPEGVEAVFTVLGRTQNPGVHYLSGSDTTQSGQYEVYVSQAATQGELTSGTNASLTVVKGLNDTFSMAVDGVTSGQITLTAGTYASGDALATEIQTQINGDSALSTGNAKIQVSYDADNNRFTLTSQKYGSVSSVEIKTSSAGTLGLNVAKGVDGQDMEGTIGGQPATSDGQVLTGKNGIQVSIDNGLSGDLGSVIFSRGLIEKLDTVLAGFLDRGGALTAKTDGLQNSLDRIAEEREKLDNKMARLEENLLTQFNAMDELISGIQGTGVFLNQQLSSLPYNNLSNNSRSG